VELWGTATVDLGFVDVPMMHLTQIIIHISLHALQRDSMKPLPTPVSYHTIGHPVYLKIDYDKVHSHSKTTLLNLVPLNTFRSSISFGYFPVFDMNKSSR